VHFTGSASKHVSLCRGNGVLAKVAWSKERILLFEEIMHSLETGYTEENIGFANVCLWHFLGTFMYPDQFEATARKNETDIIAKAVYYMKLNHERALSLEVLASKVHVSIPHFMALFKSKTGYSPIDYHNRLRIQRACQYLDLTDMKIKEISTAVGYDDPYYFSRVFRKVMGESPSVYRGKQKG
jgi:YesN/AraC family two-component response regulator